MANMSYDLSEKVNKSIFQGIALSRATSGYVLFYQSDDPPSKDGTGGTVVGNGHVAKNIDFDATTWTVTDLTATNDSTITGDANGTGNVTATHYAIFDDDDNLMFVGALTAPVEFLSGSPFEIAAGDIDITVSGAFTTAFGNDVLDHILIGTAITWPDDLSIVLTSTAPSAGSAGTQLTGTGYAPIVITANTTNFTVTDDTASNIDEIDAGTVAADWDAPAGHEVWHDGGNRLLFLSYGGSLTITEDNTAGWPAGDFTHQLA